MKSLNVPFSGRGMTMPKFYLNIMKQKLLKLIFILMLLATQTYAQDKVITGKVVDKADNQPLPGVSVTLNARKAGTVTNNKGEFSISVPQDEKSLHFAYVGYLSQSINVNSNFIEVKLVADLRQLSEVVVTGYSTQERKFIAGSISTLKGEKKPLTNANMLRYFFAIPMIPLRVMGLIHWQAFKLWLKKIKYHPKAANQHLQKDVYKPYKTN